MLICTKLIALILAVTSFFAGMFSFNRNITYYFDSVNGSDYNKGTSEFAPLKTLSLLNEMKLKSGDTVLIKTGSVFHEPLVCVQGVAYSTYGEGDKPVFMPSVNAADKTKWVEQGNGIWKFNQIIMSDAGNIIFNGGENVGKKIAKGIFGASGTVSELKNDLEFLHASNGYVYLYSDQNPAQRFERIEIACRTHGIVLASGVTLDNLCVLYAGAHGIYGRDVKDVTVKNCEVGYCGGALHYEANRYGNGIEFWSSAKNITVDSCRIYQIYDAGLTIQSENGLFENITFTNNEIDRCTYAIEYFNDEDGLFKNILIKSNMLTNSGFGWGALRPDVVHTSLINSWYCHLNRAENFIITENTLKNSKYALMNISSMCGTLPTFIGNIYMQPHSGYSFCNNTNFLTEESKALLKEMDPTGIMKYSKLPN